MLALVVALHFPAAYANADGTASASPAPTLSSGDNLDSICGATLRNPQPSPAPGAPTTAAQDANTQKLQYCQAAQSAQDGADADSALWKVWAAVGVVCTYACVASFVGGPTSQYLCMGASLAGGVTDAVVSKNFTSAMMSIAGVGVGYAANQAMNSSSEAGKKATEKDVGACLNAAMAALQAFMKYKSMQGQQDAVQSNLASAKAVQSSAASTQAAADSAYQPGQNGTGDNGTGANSGTNANNGLANNPTGTSSSAKSSCSGGGTSGGAIMQCAVASDKTLPGFITDPKFTQEFQKDSGKSLSSFLGGNGPPGGLMAQASSNGLDAGNSAKMMAAMDAVGSSVGSFDYSAGSGYAGGGGGGGSGGGEAEPDMAAMMAGLMDQLNPNGKKKEDSNQGLREVIFANQSRTPAAVTEDRKLSIFDRITYRYYYVGRRLVLGEGASQ